MPQSQLYEDRVINGLILRHNQSVATSFSVLHTNEKRKLFAMLRKLKPSHMNYLFPGALTIGEFSTAAIMQSDLARRRKRQQKRPVDNGDTSSDTELDEAHFASDVE